MTERTEIHISSHPLLKRVVHDKFFRLVLSTTVSLVINIVYALYNGALGVIGSSVWFITLCVYYLILSAMRFFALKTGRKGTMKKEIVVIRSAMKMKKQEKGRMNQYGKIKAN